MFKTNRLSLQTTASKVDWLQLVSKWFIVFINTLSFKQVTSCSMHLIVTTFRGADIKVEVANFCAAMDTLIDQDGWYCNLLNFRDNNIFEFCELPSTHEEKSQEIKIIVHRNSMPYVTFTTLNYRTHRTYLYSRL